MKFLDGITKAVSIRDGKAFQDTFGEYFNLAKGSGETGYVASCVNTMGNYFAGSKLRLYRKVKGSLREIEEHPFLELWESPNNFQVSWEIKYFMGLYLATHGNYYLLILNGASSGKPRTLIILDPSRVTPVGSKTEWIDHYEYNIGTQKIPLTREEIIHVRYPYGGSTVSGKAIIDSIADIIDVDKYQQALTKKFYKEGGFLGLTFSTTGSLTNSGFERAKTQLKEKYGGSENAFKVAIFEQGLQPIKAAYSIKDMELTAQRKLTQEEVMTAFRIPKLLLGGGAEGYTKASSESAEYTYAQTMIDPLLTYIGQVLTTHVRQMYRDPKLVVKHDSVAPKDVERKLAYYTSMVGMGALSINEVRIEEDYDPLTYELANINLLNVGGAAIRLDNGEQLGSIPNNVQPVPDAQPAQKSFEKEYDLYWKQYDRRFRKEYTQFSKTVKKFFDDQEGRLLDKLNIKASFDLEAFFNEGELQILMNMIENAYMRFLERGMSFGGFVDMNSPLIKEGILNLLNKSKSINETTKKRLTKELQEADDTEIRSTIKNTFKNFKETRIDAISKNTIGSGFNLGLWVSYKAQGYNKKMWVSQKLAETRDAHLLADGQVVGIDEAFTVGGEKLMYPQDPTASAENVINCLCVLIGIKE